MPPLLVFWLAAERCARWPIASAADRLQRACGAFIFVPRHRLTAPPWGYWAVSQTDRPRNAQEAQIKSYAKKGDTAVSEQLITRPRAAAESAGVLPIYASAPHSSVWRCMAAKMVTPLSLVCAGTQTAKLLAKQLVKMRQTKQRTMVGKSQISGLAMNAQSMAATHTMVGAMGTATKAMGTMNKASRCSRLLPLTQPMLREQAH